MSKFSGIIREIPNVSVDRFNKSNVENSAYFLSHCHSDHMKGLFDCEFLKRLQRNDYRLYCSEISYHILMNMNRGIEHYKDFINILSIHMESIITIPPSEHYPKAQEVTVTVIPAGHCPGSIMFMFDGIMGRILYTGDIRIAKGDIRKLRQLQDSEGNAKVINTLYLDTTFLNPSYRFFPPRKTSAAELCGLISEWISAESEHYVLIDTPAIHGSEYLFTEIFHKLKMKVHVHQDHFNLYQKVPEVSSAITASAALTQIHACGRYGDKKPFEDDDGVDQMFSGYNKGSWKTPCALIMQHKLMDHVRTIKPAALWYRSESLEEGCISKQFTGNYFKVPYSSHSSLDELEDIITFLKPRKIHPCVAPYGKSDPKFASKFLKDMKLQSTKKSDCSLPDEYCCSESEDESEIASPPRKKRV